MTTRIYCSKRFIAPGESENVDDDGGYEGVDLYSDGKRWVCRDCVLPMPHPDDPPPQGECVGSDYVSPSPADMLEHLRVHRGRYADPVPDSVMEQLQNEFEARELGFYWVSLNGGEPEIAHWATDSVHGGAVWWFIGIDDHRVSRAQTVRVLSGRISSPDEG